MIENVWEKIVKKLIDNNKMIATMESCTGGGIANEITSISGASSIIKEAYVTYSNEAKIKLGVSKDVIDSYSVYSIETAESMARALKEITNADVVIGVTGMLGRIDPENPVDKINHVWYTIIFNNTMINKELIAPDIERKLQKEYVINEIGLTLLGIL